MKLYLVRHGETDVNRVFGHGVSGPMHNEPVTFIEGGDINISLNIYGRSQGEQAAVNLPDKIDKFYSSPLIRARETAEIIGKIKNIDSSKIIFSDDLKEYSAGSLEGFSREKRVEIAGGKVWGSGPSCNYDFTPWGGDSWKVIYDRLSLFYKKLKEENTENEVIVCVTSAGVIRMTYKIMFDDKAPGISKHLNIGNGSVHEFIV